MVPDALWMHDAIKPVDVVVWCALWMHARDNPDVASSNRSLANTIRASERTVSRSLARLQSLGFVQSQGETINRVLHLCPDAIEAMYTLRIAN